MTSSLLRYEFWRQVVDDRCAVLILTCLQIDNSLVRKQLIIGQAVDQTILIEKRSHAVEMMNASRLSNVKQCYAHNIKRGTGIRYAYSPGGGLSEAYIGAYNGRPRMKTDIEYQIRWLWTIRYRIICWLSQCSTRGSSKTQGRAERSGAATSRKSASIETMWTGNYQAP